MYFPYLRGKQNELILLRENAESIAQSKIIPIIEPVKANLNPIKKCISALISAEAEFVFVVNPKYGDLVNNTGTMLEELLSGDMIKHPKLTLGYIFDEGSNLNDFILFAEKYSANNIAIIHYGFANGRQLKEVIEKLANITLHIFIEEHAHKRYRKNFNSGATRALVRDGFHKRSNREHPNIEHFSELHIMYKEEGMDGFGDFLIAGDDYSESGGPAYAVAIHLTLLDSDDENDMFIKHYVSDRTNTPADPGGKFLEALNKLVNDIENEDKIYKSSAIIDFQNLHDKQHYPGLGSIKKLSMQHHIELIADFLSGNQ